MFVGTLVEALILSVAGGLLGTAVAFIFFDGITASTLSSGFSQVVFSFEMSAKSFAQGILLAMLVGLLGGIFPAWRTAKLPVILALSARG